jgi:hypothetical protein
VIGFEQRAQESPPAFGTPASLRFRGLGGSHFRPRGG